VWVVQPAFFSVPPSLLVARLSGAKTWLHVQDFEVDIAFELGLLPTFLKSVAGRIESAVMSRFDRVSTISERMLERLISKSVPRSRAILFPNWVATDKIFPQNAPSRFRQELNIPTSATVVLYSGNLSLKQGLRVLLDATTILARHSDIYTVICGDGPERSVLSAIEGLPNVRLLSLQPLDRLNDLLNIADIHVLPQRANAADLVMPSKLTGMLASGRPVVATAHTGTRIADVVQQCGRVVPPGDASALAESILALARDPASRRKLGLAARAFAMEHMDAERVLAQFERDIAALSEQAYIAERAMTAH
jgi:colanic acid biosynthesis glycosyl transferase WcaI